MMVRNVCNDKLIFAIIYNKSIKQGKVQIV